MIQLNFSTVEELIFLDEQAQNILPDHMFGIFEQWKLAKRIPALKLLAQQSVLDFLNGLKDEDIDILEEYFQDRILIERLNYNVTLNLKLLINDQSTCEKLCSLEGFNHFSTWRDHEFIYLSLWR